ncbi:MAG: hypothetical protein FK730_14730 [Asgard group archaeon]|nr:hypothetical protein [Asgard group archaeon]
MKFEEFGNKIENVLLTAAPVALAESNIFNVLKLLLQKINDEKPDIYQSFIDIIAKKLMKKTMNKYFQKESKRLSDEISKYEGLSENYDFVKLHLNYMIEILGINEEQFWKNEKTAFPSENFMKSLFVLFYLHHETLNELLGRKEGIKFYRESVDKYNYVINAILQKERDKDLESMREADKEWLPRNPYGRIRLYSEVKDGRLIRICKNCEKFSALKNIEIASDKELLYNILCYMHIPLAKVWNPNFVLTIEKSIARGDPYCAYIYNDMREREDTQPPAGKYLDEIWAKYK